MERGEGQKVASLGQSSPILAVLAIVNLSLEGVACHSPQVTRSRKVDFALFTLISLELCLVTFIL